MAAVRGPDGSARRSLIWLYFTRLTSNGEGRQLNMCKICKVKLSSHNSTNSNLARHLLRKHYDITKEALGKMKQPQKSLMVTCKPTQKDERVGCASVEPSVSKVSVTRFFEETQVPGSSVCVLCGRSFGCKERTNANLLRHLRLRHAEEVPSDMWPQLDASLTRDSDDGAQVLTEPAQGEFDL